MTPKQKRQGELARQQAVAETKQVLTAILKLLRQCDEGRDDTISGSDLVERLTDLRPRIVSARRALR